MHPSKLYLLVGNNGCFNCFSTSKVEWFFNNGRMLSNVETTDNTINIIHARLENQGYYDCRGITIEKYIFYARGLLIVRGSVKSIILIKNTLIIIVLQKFQHLFEITMQNWMNVKEILSTS